MLGRFAEDPESVRRLIAEAADETERLVERIHGDDEDPIGEVMG